MMVPESRSFASLVTISLDELVPHDHFYRHLSDNVSDIRYFVLVLRFECGNTPEKLSNSGKIEIVSDTWPNAAESFRHDAQKAPFMAELRGDYSGIL